MILQTKDLVLRTVTRADTAQVARMWEYEKGEITPCEAEKAIAYMQGNHKRNRPGVIYHLCLAVYEKRGEAIIGWCGLDGKTRGKLHLFYLIDSNYRNRGYATQCAQALLSYAFDDVKTPFINGGCDKNNIASFRVMEKIGMERAGTEENGDPLFYIDKAAYLAQKGLK